jgi:hypothetical protein
MRVHWHSPIKIWIKKISSHRWVLREAGSVSAPRPTPQLPSHALSPRAYEKEFIKNTSSHVTIPKYRQGVGDMMVPLQPHVSIFRSLSPHQDHLKPGTPE